MISKEEIKAVSDLCKLEFNETETEELENEINNVLKHMDMIAEANIEGIEPTYFVNDRIQELREDIVSESMDTENIMRNAPEEQYGYFKLKNIIED